MQADIHSAYGYPTSFEDLTHGQARFPSIPSNTAEVLNLLTTLSHSFFRR